MPNREELQQILILAEMLYKRAKDYAPDYNGDLKYAQMSYEDKLLVDLYRHARVVRKTAKRLYELAK